MTAHVKGKGACASSLLASTRSTITTMECSFALTGKDYVIIAADTTAARSIVKMKIDEDKIKTLSPHLLMAYSGESGSSTFHAPPHARTQEKGLTKTSISLTPPLAPRRLNPCRRYHPVRRIHRAKHQTLPHPQLLPTASTVRCSVDTSLVGRIAALTLALLRQPPRRRI
jgi:Proteasome subunit